MSTPHERVASLQDQIRVLRGELAYLRTKVAEHSELLKWLEEQARRRAT